MRVAFSFLFSFLILSGGVFAEFKIPEHIAKAEVSSFLIPKGKQVIIMPVEYAKAPIQHSEKYNGITAEQVYSIELVFTRYPADFKDWRTDYNWLLEHRLMALYELDSGLFDNPEIEWKYILQTGPTNEPDAKTYFHGWVIRYSPVPPQKEPTEKLKQEAKDNPDLRKWSQIIFDKNPKLRDSSAFKVLQRHPEWKDMLVVMDWTSSMYENGASVLNWHRKYIRKQAIKHLIIFNDGGGRPHHTKYIGKTGGLYYCQPENMEHILLSMVKAKNATMGGDSPENDMEAILKGARSCKDYGEIVLIPDRNSSVRDIALIKYMDKPVRIIFFRNEKMRLSGLGVDSRKLVDNHWIHPNYLSIASMTGGSIHLENRDILGLDKLKVGETFSFKEFTYVKEESGIFKYVKPK